MFDSLVNAPGVDAKYLDYLRAFLACSPPKDHEAFLMSHPKLADSRCFASLESAFQSLRQSHPECADHLCLLRNAVSLGVETGVQHYRRLWSTLNAFCNVVRSRSVEQVGHYIRRNSICLDPGIQEITETATAQPSVPQCVREHMRNCASLLSACRADGFEKTLRRLTPLWDGFRQLCASDSVCGCLQVVSQYPAVASPDGVGLLELEKAQDEQFGNELWASSFCIKTGFLPRHISLANHHTTLTKFVCGVSPSEMRQAIQDDPQFVHCEAVNWFNHWSEVSRETQNWQDHRYYEACAEILRLCMRDGIDPAFEAVHGIFEAIFRCFQIQYEELPEALLCDTAPHGAIADHVLDYAELFAQRSNWPPMQLALAPTGII